MKKFPLKTSIAIISMTICLTGLINSINLVSASSSSKTSQFNGQDKQPLQLQLANWPISPGHRLLSQTQKQLSRATLLDREQVPIEGKLSDTSMVESIGGPDFEPASCQLAKVVLVLQRPGCQTKAISSYACTGSCPSYVQVSGSKDWKHERSCSCCQQTALREDTFVLDCPALSPPYREVKTYAPVNCICRSCSDISRENIRPQELVEALEGQSNTMRQ